MTVKLPPRALPRRANPSRWRDYNRQLILGELHSNGPLGRAEIARRSGLTIQAVSNIIAELEEDGLLRAAGPVKGRRGLPSIQYRVNPSGGYALGIEIRPAVALATLVDLSGQLVWQDRRPLKSADPATVTALLPKLRDAGLAKVPAARGRLMGAGVVMPGPFGRTALSGTATDLPGWEDAEPARLCADALDLQVIVENDANAAAMAERIALASEGLDTFACLYFGTGLGLGIVHGGQLIAGAFGNAGEIGQIPIVSGTERCTLESILSRAAIERRLAGSGVSVIDMDALAALHASGDPNIRSWIDEAADALQQAMIVIENLLDPQATILCGAMPRSVLGDLVAATDLPTTIARREDATGPALRIGTCSRMAAARGAAALILARSFTPLLPEY